jgi:hypothetical protein
MKSLRDHVRIGFGRHSSHPPRNAPSLCDPTSGFNFCPPPVRMTV